MTKFVVIDEEGHVSWNDKAENPEAFQTFGAAEKRALGMAKLDAGQTVRIYELVAEVVAPVSEPKTTRVSKKARAA